MNGYKPQPCCDLYEFDTLYRSNIAAHILQLKIVSIVTFNSSFSKFYASFEENVNLSYTT